MATETSTWAPAPTALQPRARARLAAAGVVIAALAVSACDPNRVNNQTVGAGVGAVGGALIGSTIGAGGGQIAATVIGGLIGALVGSQVGAVIDENDRLRAREAEYRALEGASGRETVWTNPDKGVTGRVRPEPHYRGPSGEICRDYTHTITIDGRAETARGTACRLPDGSWQVV